MLGVLLLIWGAIWMQMRQEYAAIGHETMKETSNLALAFEENIIRSITAIDQVILITRDSYARDTARSDLRNWAHERPFMNDQTMQISIIGVNGVLLQSNLGPTPQPVDLHDREHFSVHVGSSQDVLFISKPVIGRVSGRYSVQFTRKIIGPDGEFLGVVVVSLDPDYLARFYEALQLGHGFIMLVGQDGYMRAGRPAPVLVGKPLVNSPLLAMAARVDHGSYQTAASAITGQPALVSYRRLADYPLIVAVGYGTESEFAPYRLHRFQSIVGGLGLSVLAIGAGLLLARHRRRLTRYQDALTATLGNMSQGIIMVDRDRRIAVINRRVGELLGLPPDLIHADTTFDAILQWQVENGEFAAQYDVSIAMDSLLERGGLDASVPMYERTRPDGSVLEVRTSLLANGGAVRTYTDVTERKRIVRDLAAARDVAEAAGRARSEFLAVMSHEIRTPLNGIIGATGLLMDGELDTEEAHFVEIIRHSGEHLLQLINNILDFSRLDASCIELEAVAFDLRTTIESAVDMVATAARAKGIGLDVTISDGVPRCVIGDPGRLRQVLLNLLGNGVKFTERGGVHLVASRAASEAGTVRLAVSVSDTGIGIPDEALPRLFHEFSQVDGSISRRFGGSGLGLAISRRLVERMGGSMTVESVPSEGSKFRFGILLREAPASPPGDDSRRTVVSGEQRRLRILLVEDNGTNRLVATRMLERMGHCVDAVVDGYEAVQTARSMPHDLILMDVMMPGMDGLTATRQIRAGAGSGAKTPIIGLTANAESGKAAECRAAGMDGVVTKPVTAERLADAMRMVVVDGGAPPDATPQTWPLFDDHVLSVLAEDIGDDGALDVAHLFLAEAPRMEQRLEQSCAGSVGALLREVHTLASCARSVGLLRVGYLAGEIERAMANAEPEPERLAALRLVLRESVARLAVWTNARMVEAVT
jgi:signal transduction histidine kinase/ActR/RegA family two-component response regulator/HPt (histidine-containing phosphotransfer) domain-containing protein